MKPGSFSDHNPVPLLGDRGGRPPRPPSSDTSFVYHEPAAAQFSCYISIMNLNSIRDAIKREPFQEFDLHLADGRIAPVKHPEFVAMTTRVGVVAGEDHSVAILEPHLIVSLEYRQRGARGNGSSKKGKPRS
jgi:hypothetical protein